MPSIQVTVKGAHGLHARPAALFVKKAASFASCVIKVVKGTKECDAKSIMGLMSMAIDKGQEIEIKAEGERADEALAALAEIAQDETL